MTMTSDTTLFEKYEHLKHIIRSYGKVGIAFSGGIDSTLLLFAASEALSREKVIAIHGRSILNLDGSVIEGLYQQCFKSHAQLKIIELTPLGLPEFVNNDSRRCYYCKKKTYLTFIDFLKTENCSTLLDGTNTDDLNETRPGLAVLEELSVKTPLVDAGISKKEIRFLAKSFELPNYAMPSNSCLATRLVFSPQITEEGLMQVEKIEKYLKNIGFLGCRVKPKEKDIIVEIEQHDFSRFSRIHNRIAFSDFCQRMGIKKVYLDICGRH